MEYSFVHHRGTLWTISGPREPDEQLWHVQLPMHPEDPLQTIPLESAGGESVQTTVLELAGLLLGSTEHEDSYSSASGLRPQRTLSGSVAQLTSRLGPVVAAAGTQQALRELLTSMIASIPDPGWVEVQKTGPAKRPWTVAGVALPDNMKRAPQQYASESAASRNADRLRQEARRAVVSGLTGLPVVRIGVLMSGEKDFSLAELLRISSALKRSPIDVAGLGPTQ